MDMTLFWTVVQALNQGFVQTLKLFAVTLVCAAPLGLVVSFGSMSRRGLHHQLRLLFF